MGETFWIGRGLDTDILIESIYIPALVPSWLMLALSSQAPSYRKERPEIDIYLDIYYIISLTCSSPILEYDACHSQGETISGVH